MGRRVYLVWLGRRFGYSGIHICRLGDAVNLGEELYLCRFAAAEDGGGTTTNGNQTTQQATCGVNPLTNKPGITPNESGIRGELRPGVGGRGTFRARRGGGKRLHAGIDISAQVGSWVFPIATGRITVSGSASSTSGYGLKVTIDHGNGYTSSYSHLSDTGFGVENGATAFGLLALSGQSGNASGQPATEAHVHFEARKNGIVLDPVKFLNSLCPEDFRPSI